MQINLNTDNPRADFVLQYETTEIFIAAMTGLKVRKSKASWTRAAKAGEIIRLALPAESEIVGRVVLGELAAEEEAQWIAEAGSSRLGRGDDEATEERPRATREPEETTTAPSGLQPPPNIF